MSLTARQGAPQTRQSRLLVTAILFSIVVLPLCAAEGNDTTAADTAATAANNYYSVSPAALSISAVKGATATRTITFIKSTPETTIDNVAIVPQDLISTDGKAINATEIEPGTLELWNQSNAAQILVTFHFNKSVSGAYSGMLAITSNTSTTMMPVSVNLKDDLFLPIVVLAGVTVLSVGFYDYAMRGRRRDAVINKMNDMTSRFTYEFPEGPTREYTKYFEEKITTLFEEAKRRIQQNDYDNAESMYAKGEEVWMHWILFRGEWSGLIRQSVTIKTDIENIRNKVCEDLHENWPEKEDFPLGKGIHKDLSIYWGGAADIETRSSVTRDLLNGLEARRALFLYYYNNVQKYIKGYEEKNSEIPGCLTEHRKRILSLNFDARDQETVTFLTEMQTEDNQYTKCLKENGLPAKQKMSDADQRVLANYMIKKAPDEHVKRSKWPQWVIDFIAWLKPQGSRIRLWVFDKLNTIFLPAVVLFVIGYTTLYEKNPTFGANLSDYFYLIVWAFGTGTASESLVTLIKANNAPAI